MTTRTQARDVDTFVDKVICRLPVITDRDEQTTLIVAHQEGVRALARLARVYGRLIVGSAAQYDGSHLVNRDANMYVRISRARSGFARAVLAHSAAQVMERFEISAAFEISKSLERPSPEPNKDQRLLTLREVLAPYKGGRRIGPETARKLVRAVQRGHAARERLLLCNGGLIMKIAKEKYSSVPLWDRCSEGRIGLMTAIDRFDVNRGIAFSTYAGLWIRQAMGYYQACHRRNVRLPAQLQEKIWRFRRQREVLGDEASLGDVAAAAKVDIELAREFPMLGQAEVSLASPVGCQESDGDALTLGDALKDGASLPDETAAQREASMKIERALATLPPREQTAIVGKYFSEMTHKEIGRQLLRVSHNRVQQLEAQGIKRLRKQLEAVVVSSLNF